MLEEQKQTVMEGCRRMILRNGPMTPEELEKVGEDTKELRMTIKGKTPREVIEDVLSESDGFAEDDSNRYHLTDQSADK